MVKTNHKKNVKDMKNKKNKKRKKENFYHCTYLSDYHYNEILVNWNFKTSLMKDRKSDF